MSAAPPRSRTPGDELADATAHGGVYLRRLVRAQLALSLVALVAFGGLLGSLPLVLLLVGRLQRRHARAASRSPTCSWPCRRSRSSSSSAWIYRRRADALDDAFRERWCAANDRARRWSPRWCSWRSRLSLSGVRVARTHLRPLRGLAGRLDVVERRRDLRRVPVRGELPRHRRPDAQDRRGRAVAGGRLRGRLPRAAAVRGGAAAPVRRRTRSPTSPRPACGSPRAAAAVVGGRAR